MKQLYNISISLFPVFLRLISPIHKKAKLMIEGRRGIEAKIKNTSLAQKVVWFHCASLGEFEQGRPIIESIKAKYAETSIVVTFFSPSGYEVMKDYEQADLILYLPFDSKNNARKFIELLNPQMAIFIKYEFWYNFLDELKGMQIPTFLVSGIFRQDQKFFKKGWPFFKNMLSCFDQFFVQNKVSEELLNSVGIDNVTVSGDTRFDRVKEICNKPKRIEIAEQFVGNHPVLVIGSSWPEDLDVLYPLINGDLPMKFIIAPHEISKPKIQKLIQGLQCSFQLFSQADSEKIIKSRVLIIDNIGMLSSLYQYGQLAYIGGAFGEGLHNILEAATFGMPIIFGNGKDNHKYQEAIDLVASGGAFEVSDPSEVISIVEELLQDDKKLKSASEISANYVKNNAGATEIFMNHIHKYLV